MNNRVVIVGKPNVGKSQLFNRLVGEKHSVVVDEPGVTRDRITLEVFWGGKKILLTDTGGYTTENFSFQDEINRQTQIAINESNLVLFLISYKDGIDDDDLYLAKMLKKNSLKNAILVANKFDSERTEPLNEYRLGFGDAICVSAEHGINTGLLLNTIVEKLNLSTYEKPEEKRIKLAIIGKPNVGKSSLVNALLQEERIIISNNPGTTRDAIDIDFDYLDKKYRFIDTPGIRRHASIRGDEKEKFSLLRSKKAIARSNILLFVFDISEPLVELDERIGGFVYEANIPTLLVANKWDLILDKSDSERRRLEEDIRSRFKFLSWAPIVFISAKNKQKLNSIFKFLDAIEDEISKEISPLFLDNFLIKVSSLFAVPKVKGKRIKLYSLSKIDGQVPTFLITCNDPGLLHFSYSRLIENQLRTGFSYKYTPITVIYKKKI